MFTNPQPEIFKKEYFQLSNRIFPCKQTFIDFLNETEYEKLVEYAKNIVIRLSYESNFPPPILLLENLLKLESNVDHRILFDNYIGRDHFVHLVNLYLLGVYLFFYMPLFGKSVYEEFDDLNNFNHFNANGKLKTLKNFIRAWRSFVIYHDIAYPIEAFFRAIPGQRKYVEGYVEPFVGINKYIKGETTIRVLSKILTLYIMLAQTEKKNHELAPYLTNLTESTYILDKHLSFNFKIEINIERDQTKINLIETNNIIEEDLIKQFEHYQEAEKVFGFESLKYLLALYDKKEIIGVLICNETHNVMAINCYVKSKKIRLNIVPKKISQTLTQTLTYDECLFNDEMFPIKNMHWKYFVKDVHKKKEFILNLFGNMEVNTPANDVFHSITKMIELNENTRFYKITNDKQFKDYCFNLYNYIHQNCINMFYKDSLKKPIEYRNYLMTSNYNDFLKKYSLMIFNHLSDYMGSNPSELDMDDINIYNPEFVVEQLFKKIIEKKKEAIEHISKSIIEKYNQEIDTQTYMCEMLNIITDCLVSTPDDMVLYKSLNDFYCDDNLCSILNSLDENLAEKVNGKLKLNNMSIIQLFNEYREDDLLDNNSKSAEAKIKVQQDHGILSAVIQVYSYEFLEKTNFKSLEQTTGLKSFNDRILWNYTTSKDDMVNKHKKTSDLVFHAIFTHNIYSDSIKRILGKEYSFKTTLTSSPFAYFAIFSDSLQPWDRRRIVHQDFRKIPYNIYSSSFDIAIKDNILYISETGNQIDIIKEFANLKKGLDDYLEHASDYIRLNLSESP